MARIKAKPMNRVPIAPINKKGFRTTPSPAVFDPAAAAFAQPQRFVYPNSTPITQGGYGGQVPMFVSFDLIIYFFYILLVIKCFFLFVLLNSSFIPE